MTVPRVKDIRRLMKLLELRGGSKVRATNQGVFLDEITEHLQRLKAEGSEHARARIAELRAKVAAQIRPTVANAAFLPVVLKVEPLLHSEEIHRAVIECLKDGSGWTVRDRLVENPTLLELPAFQESLGHALEEETLPSLLLLCALHLPPLMAQAQIRTRIKGVISRAPYIDRGTYDYISESDNLGYNHLRAQSHISKLEELENSDEYQTAIVRTLAKPEQDDSLFKRIVSSQERYDPVLYTDAIAQSVLDAPSPWKTIDIISRSRFLAVFPEIQKAMLARVADIAQAIKTRKDSWQIIDALRGAGSIRMHPEIQSAIGDAVDLVGAAIKSADRPDKVFGVIKGLEVLTLSPTIWLAALQAACEVLHVFSGNWSEHYYLCKAEEIADELVSQMASAVPKGAICETLRSMDEPWPVVDALLEALTSFREPLKNFAAHTLNDPRSQNAVRSTIPQIANRLKNQDRRTIETATLKCIESIYADDRIQEALRERPK